jgi:predicted flap endonuclease-1-like 5' DNA nuclease
VGIFAEKSSETSGAVEAPLVVLETPKGEPVDAAKKMGEVVEGPEAIEIPDVVDIPPEQAHFLKQEIEYVEGIGPVYGAKLRAVGVNSPLDLLRKGATRKGRELIAAASGITLTLILKWVNHADLYRLKGVGSEYADLLEAAGVDTVVELAMRNPANLHDKLTVTNEEKKLVRKVPAAAQVEDWVAQAKQLGRVVRYD